MLTASSILLALGVTAAVGGIATAWLWLVQRPRAEREEGLQLLSAMRWRELSKLVVDGLRARGFEPETAEDAAERGQDSVLHLKRDSREWLLACKQGHNYRITPTVVADMTDAVRFHGANGGVIATPGIIDPQARKLSSSKIELIDGEELWPLVRSQLAPGVREELLTKSRQVAIRQSSVALAAALTLGLVVAVLMPKHDDGVASVPSAAPVATHSKPVAIANNVPTLAPAPVSEDEQRDDVIRMVSTLPGVERAMWSTRSTLMIYLADETSDPVSGICDIVEKYDSLRTSRLHLQPPAGATRPARFLQCTTF
jgi:restriction system protein